MSEADDAALSALRDSWEENAALWIEVAREGGIESRRLGTDAAILKAVAALGPATLLDLGCGEGWLLRSLAEGGVSGVGIDGSRRLVEAARAAGGGRFEVMDFDAFAAAPRRLGTRFDCIVANFAFLQDDLEPLLIACRRVLSPGGRLLVQTLHPWTQKGRYRDGWREESFSGFGQGGWRPMPYYFRTLGSWTRLLRDCGWQLAALDEPRHPTSGDPLSLLLQAERATSLPDA